MKRVVNYCLQALSAVGVVGVLSCVVLATEPAVVRGPIVNPANGHRYYLFEESTWRDAESAAHSLGGALVTIIDEAEDIWVFDTFHEDGQYGLWIGLNDAATEGSFVWTSGEPSTYTNWAVGQPDNSGDEDFGMIFVNENGSPSARRSHWNDFRHTALEWDTSGGRLHGIAEVVPEPASGLGGFLYATLLFWKRRGLDHVCKGSSIAW